MIIAVDFDGTCTTHDFPKVGKDIGAVPVLKKLVEQGHQLILWTMRCDGNEKLTNRNYLTKAVEWFKENDIPLYGVQENPGQCDWTSSRKCYAQMYIDDAALGCPLKFDPSISDRPFVDWEKVEILLKEAKILN